MGKETSKRYLLGFDLGGTKMLAAVFNHKYEIVSRCKRRTRADRGADEVFSRMVNTIEDACKEAGIKPSALGGIGIGAPGPLDPYKGVIIHTPNLGFKNFPLKAKLAKKFGIPVVVDNDVNVGTYGEYHFGAGKGYRHVIGVFPGTGIGGGLVLDGKLYRGSNGSAGEVGHIIVQPNGPLCGCGQRGCIEAIASKTSLAKEAVALVSRGRAPIIAEGAGTDLKEVRSGILGRAFESGDKDIRKVVLYAAEYLGICLANLVNILNPEVIVLGGGVVEAMPDEFVKTAAKSMKAHAMAFPCKDVKVSAAKLGDDAVIRGAAKLIEEEIEGGNAKETGK